MTKLQYLEELERGLRHKLPTREVNEIMRDYAEYFVEGTRQGKSEWEVVQSLGDARDVAAQIVNESRGEAPFAHTGDARNKRSGWRKPNFEAGAARVARGAKGAGQLAQKLGKLFLLLMLCPFIFILLISAAGIVIGLLGALLGMLAACAALLVGAFITLIGFVYSLGALPFSASALALVAVLGLAAGSIFGGSLLLAALSYIVRKIYLLLSRSVTALRNRYRARRGEPPLPPQPERAPQADTAPRAQAQADATAVPQPDAASGEQVLKKQREIEDIVREVQQHFDSEKESILSMPNVTLTLDGIDAPTEQTPQAGACTAEAQDDSGENEAPAATSHSAEGDTPPTAGEQPCESTEGEYPATDNGDTEGDTPPTAGEQLGESPESEPSATDNGDTEGDTPPTAGKQPEGEPTTTSPTPAEDDLRDDAAQTADTTDREGERYA